MTEMKVIELIGQFYYQICQCLFACHSTSVSQKPIPCTHIVKQVGLFQYQYWQLGVVCGLGSLRFPVITESNGHHTCSSQEDKEDFNYWLKLSQSRYTVLGTKHNSTLTLLLCRLCC